MRDGGGRLRCRRHTGGGRGPSDGLLVHYDAGDPAFFERRLAEAVNSLVADPERARQYGQAGRQRCIQEFSWAHIAEQTLEIYRKVSS